MKSVYAFMACMSVFFAMSCAGDKKTDEKTAMAAEAVDVKTERLDAALWEDADVDTTMMRLWTQMAGVPDVTSLKASKMFTMFEPDVLKVFPPKTNPLEGLDALGSRWNTIMDKPFPIKSAATIVLPTMQQIVVSDSALFVVLNHYLGAEHPAYNGFPEYKRATKVSARILPDVAEALVALNYPDSSTNLMQAMVYQGALVEAVMQLTGQSEQQMLGYTDIQISEAAKMQERVWNDLIKRKLLLSTDPAVMAQMIAPSPATTIVSPDAPGRLGRFIGHRLVNPSGKKATSAVSTMLTPEFYMNPDVVRNTK